VPDQDHLADSKVIDQGHDVGGEVLDGERLVRDITPAVSPEVEPHGPDVARQGADNGIPIGRIAPAAMK